MPPIVKSMKSVQGDSPSSMVLDNETIGLILDIHLMMTQAKADREAFFATAKADREAFMAAIQQQQQ
ncbi:hypothetical protein VKT23_009004 [Stygiomarasmius scandens]|uniref:Uncharacterized protein n=1 Tax=Marasmiellus scandens TaxID=2682957 RepID=A0ABR1JH94_9AGAR